MDRQRTVFAKAMTWLLGELIDQRAEEPVAFLAQLGRDHRKYGVTQRHYDSMQDALLTTLRSHLIDQWDGRLADAADQAVHADRRHHARRRRRREGAALPRRHRRRTPPGHPRRVGHPAAARRAAVLPPRSVRHRAGAAVAAALAVPEPVDPRRPRRRHRVPRPLGARRHGQHRDRRRDDGPATGGGCPTRTARCTSIATAATC